jgi:hypothetical protein
MPEFLTITVTEHHNEEYCGNYCEISGLVLLVDRALKSYTDFNASSDAFTNKLPEELVYKLGLTNEMIFESVEEVLDCSENLNIMVSAMTG